VQIYTDEATLLDSLEGFAGAGLRDGESVVVIATAPHLHELEIRLRGRWIDLDRARREDRYIAILAPEMLARFFADGRLDLAAFRSVAQEVVKRARGSGNRPVRAFGEMVALLWADGHADEALQLETFWTQLQMAEKFPVFCAYPRGLFKMDSQFQITAVCGAHNQVVPGCIA
jgi:hypothetical protein